MSQRFLLVDGHNVIFAWPELRGLHARRTEAARDELIHILTRYQDVSGVRVVVAFDGGTAQRPQSATSGDAGIQVFYANAGRQADTILERLVAKYAARHDITVASGDAMIRQTAITFGASVITTDALRDEIARADAELARALEQRRRER